MGASRWRRSLSVAGVASALIATLIGTPTAVQAATPAYCSLPGLDTFRWDNEAGTGLWADPKNWNHHNNANDTAPGEAGPAAVDDYACIPSGATVRLDLGGEGVSADLAALDLGSSATLTVGRGGKLYVHGGSSRATPSYARSLSTLNFNASTLGGEGTLTVSGTLNWTSTSDGAATQTTRDCDLGAPCPDGATTTPGHTVIASSGKMVIAGRGVNLEDKRVIDNRGTTTISGEGYVAADYGTSIINRGTFTIASGRGIYQGRQRYGLPRGAFVDSGVLRKTAAGTSVIDATWSRPAPGTITVTAGYLSIYANRNGSTTTSAAGVGPGASFGTGGCNPAASSTCASPTATAADKQTAAVALPALGKGTANVSLRELPGEQTAWMRTAPTSVETPGAKADAAHPMTFTFAMDTSLRHRGETADGLARTIGVYREPDGATTYSPVPDCGKGGVSSTTPSCVDRASSVNSTRALANGDVVVVVKTLQNSRWTL